MVKGEDLSLAKGDAIIMIFLSLLLSSLFSPFLDSSFFLSRVSYNIKYL